MNEMIVKVKKFIVPILGVLLIIAIGVAVYFFQQSNRNPDAEAAREVAALVEEVGKLIVLPEGETPTIATVSEPDRLRDQAFFAQAKAGDKVLLYSTARKAYLYDPIAKKLIEVAPLSIGANEEQ